MKNSDAGTWLLASAALGRPVPVDEPYPHIHDRTIPADQTVSGKAPVVLWRRDCAACAANQDRSG